MNPGKEICRELKELRKQIAEENGIHLEIEECKFKGKCDGTCPRCDAEVRYLEGALADRIRMGKVAVVAGLALGLSATATLSAESGAVAFSGIQPVVKELVLPTDSVRITGRVVDSLTGEGLYFVAVRVLDGNRLVVVTNTDEEGNFVLRRVPKGKYNIEFVYGYGVSIRAGKYVIYDFVCTEDHVLPTIKIKISEIESVIGDIKPKFSDSVTNEKKYTGKHGRKNSSRRK